MEAKYISKEGNDVTFTMSITADELEAAQNETYVKTRGKYSINGFRKGKAPRKLIEQHYGEGVFMEEAVEELVQSSYPRALRELDLDPIDKPNVELGDLSKEEGFVITAKVAVIPEVDVKDYAGVEIKSFEHNVTEEDVQEELEKMQKRNSRLLDADRPAEDSDTLTIDYEGRMDGEAFEGGSGEDYNLKLGSGHFIAGFEEQLIGAEKSSDVTVDVTFPDDYPTEDMQGKAAVFEVKVKEIKYEELPDLNDEFAQEASEFDSMPELIDDTRAKLEEAAAKRTEKDQKNAVLESVYNANEVDAPDIMVEDQMDTMMDEYASNLRQQGIDMDMYFKYMGQDSGEFRENLREDAVKRVKMRLIIKAIVAAEGFSASDEEIEEEIRQMGEQYDIDVDKLKKTMGEDQIDLLRTDIKERKAVDYMFEMAVIEHDGPDDIKPGETEKNRV